MFCSRTERLPRPWLLLSLALVWPWGCSVDGTPEPDYDDAVDDDAMDDDDDTGGGTVFSAVEAVVSGTIPTVITVRWGVGPGDVEQSWVDFGPDDDHGRRIAGHLLADTERWEAFLLGNKPQSDVHLQVGAVVDGQTYVTEPMTRTTGPAPSDLPGIQVDTLDAQRAVHGFFVTTILTIPSWAVIIDTDGDYVWWHQPPEDWEAIFSSRARLSGDGRSML